MKKQLLLTFTLSFISTGLIAGDIENQQLLAAIRLNNLADVQAAIECAADVNVRDQDGNTPLHLAALNPAGAERKAIITKLVTHGAHINLKNAAGHVPADLARTMPEFEDIQELLGVGSCPICLQEITPLDTIERGNKLFGCDPRHIMHHTCAFDDARHQRTAICPTCRATLNECAAHAERRSLRHSHFVNQHALEIPIAIRLIAAAASGNAAQIQALLAQGANVNTRRDNSVKTALILAARNGHTAVINALLTHPDLDINAQNSDGHSALCIARARGHEEIAHILAKHGTR